MLSFAKLEAALGRYLAVHDQQRGAFRSRLKQLQRLGIPRGVNNGRATRVSYTVDQLLELAFVLELLRCGLTPERAIRIMTTWWDWLRRAFLIARDRPFPVAIAFLQADFVGYQEHTETSGAMMAAGDDGCAIVGLDPRDSRRELERTLAQLASSRAIVINVTAVLEGLTSALGSVGVESAFVWAQTERWREDRDALGRSIDPKENRHG